MRLEKSEIRESFDALSFLINKEINGVKFMQAQPKSR